MLLNHIGNNRLRGAIPKVGIRPTIDGREKGNVIKVNASFVTISGFTIRNSSKDQAGIQLGNNDYILDSINCVIEENNIELNGIGIRIYEGEKHQVEKQLKCEHKWGKISEDSQGRYRQCEKCLCKNYNVEERKSRVKGLKITF